MRGSFFIPAVGALAIVGIFGTLMAVLVNGPYTHANLMTGVDESYTRTVMTPIGAPVLYAPPGLAVSLSSTTPLAERGKAQLVAQGCAGCHGMDGKGGVVGPPIVPDIEVIREMVRQGPGGMPVFSSRDLTDYDLTAIAVYLHSVNK